MTSLRSAPSRKYCAQSPVHRTTFSPHCKALSTVHYIYAGLTAAFCVLLRKEPSGWLHIVGVPPFLLTCIRRHHLLNAAPFLVASTQTSHRSTFPISTLRSVSSRLTKRL